MSTRWLVRLSDGYAFRAEGLGKVDMSKFRVVESDTNPMDGPVPAATAPDLTPNPVQLDAKRATARVRMKESGDAVSGK
jgi:hypothetical protein